MEFVLAVTNLNQIWSFGFFGGTYLDLSPEIDIISNLERFNDVGK